MSQTITPEKIETTNSSGVNYDIVLEQFGCQYITPEILDKLRTLTGKDKLHNFLERGFFFAHRDFDKLVQHCIETKENNFYLYTGRGPSSQSLHIGHLIPFMMTKYLQDVFNVPVIIQITDDEKYFHSKSHEDTPETYQTFAMQNIKDIIACGFDQSKTFIFLNSAYSNYMTHNLTKIQKKINLNNIRSVFGYGDEDNMGKVSFPVCQMVPSFASSFPGILTRPGVLPNMNPIEMFQYKTENSREFDSVLKTLQHKRCLIVAAVDQDPYFRVLRDVATKMKEHKPALIYSKFLSSLLGKQTKMSASIQNSAIYLEDTPKQVKKKINCSAFSGGKETVELHRELGGDLKVDVAFQYLEIFYNDDAKLAQIASDYSSGKMLTGDLKKILIELLNCMLEQHQIYKASITNDVIYSFMTPRCLDN